MPLIWCRPVTVEEYDKAMQEAEYYQAPVYTNMQVGGQSSCGGNRLAGHDCPHVCMCALAPCRTFHPN